MKRMLYVVTSGIDMPRMLYLPLILAEDALERGWEVSLFFVMRGVVALKKEEAEKIKVEKMQRFDDYVSALMAKGVKFYAQHRAIEIFDLFEPDFLKGVEVRSGRDLNELVFEMDKVMYF